jgi:hypothetical protein
MGSTQSTEHELNPPTWVTECVSSRSRENLTPEWQLTALGIRPEPGSHSSTWDPRVLARYRVCFHVDGEHYECFTPEEAAIMQEMLEADGYHA